MAENSDKGFAEIKKNFDGLRFDNTNTETGFLYRWYHDEENFYYRLNHPAEWRKGRLNKIVFFEYWLKLKGYSDEEIYEIWDKLDILRRRRRERMDRRTLSRYEKNKNLNECFYELTFQRQIEQKSWDDLRRELIDKPWEKKILKRMGRGLRFNTKFARYLQKNPRASFRELQRQFSLCKTQVEAILSGLKEYHVAPGKKLTAEMLCRKN
jgi:hypothetical protein